MPKHRRGLKVLVSAGPTRERWDRVRYLGNFSSGRMGYAIAAAARRRGHDVTLVSGPVALDPPKGVEIVRVESAREMKAALSRAFDGSDGLVMAAAVADFRPARPVVGKFEKPDGRGREPVALRLVRNPDIVAGLARRKGRRIVGGFALEARAGTARAERKLARKNLDFIVLNRPETLASPFIAATVLFADGSRRAARLSGRKEAVAGRIVRILEDLHAGREGPVRGPAKKAGAGRRR